jgi:hypothetical protein
VASDRDIPEKTQYTTESLVVYCFDFSRFPEVLNGGTLSSPTMAVVASVTQGTPAVLTADFQEGSTDGPVAVASGKGVKVAVTCTTAGRYQLACSVTITLDAVTTVRTKRLNLIVE